MQDVSEGGGSINWYEGGDGTHGVYEDVSVQYKRCGLEESSFGLTIISIVTHHDTLNKHTVFHTVLTWRLQDARCDAAKEVIRSHVDLTATIWLHYPTRG